MKSIIVIFSIMFFVPSLFSQQKNIATYKVTNYQINGENYDGWALKNDIALSFYICDSETLCFANFWRKSDSQSYGEVYAINKREIPETAKTYGATEIKFTWYFFNSYDDDRGEAAVTFIRIYINNTVKFHAEIVVMKTNEVLILDGYQE